MPIFFTASSLNVRLFKERNSPTYKQEQIVTLCFKVSNTIDVLTVNVLVIFS
jgi:hypothetical protein